MKSLQAQSWNPEYKTLDHWRGIAALWVMIFHGFGSINNLSVDPLVKILQLVAAPGWLGVHIFFVISGYCISASIYRLILKNNSKATIFIRNRAWRLLPVYWMAFIVTITINFILSLFNNKTSFWEHLPHSWFGWIGNIFLIQPYLNTTFYVVVYWTLVVEVQFYLFLALLLIIQYGSVKDRWKQRNPVSRRNRVSDLVLN